MRAAVKAIEQEAGVECPNCGGRELDDDGDCKKCREPVKAPAELSDGNGDAVPEKLREVFTRAAEFDESITAINRLIRWANEIAEHPAGSFFNAPSAVHQLKAVKESLKFARPYQATCAGCGGRAKKKADCGACKGAGWLCRFNYEQLREDRPDKKAARK